MLRAYIEQHPDLRLVIIDTLARVRAPHKTTNVYAEDYTVIQEVKQLADNYGIAILLVTHLRKMPSEDGDVFNEVSGSTGLTGAADTCIVLKRGRGEVEAVLHVTGRDVVEQTFDMSFDGLCGRWIIEGDALPNISPERMLIVQHLRQSDKSLSPAEIADKTGKKAVSIRKLMADMEKDGQIKKVGHGQYTSVGNIGNNSNFGNSGNFGNH